MDYVGDLVQSISEKKGPKYIQVLERPGDKDKEWGEMTQSLSL
jgi:hypothetical protein